MTEPTTTNPGAQTGVTIVEQAIQAGVGIGKGFLYADFPFLAAPVLKQLSDYLIGLIAGYIIRGVARVVAFSIIDLQVEAEVGAMQAALIGLLKAQKSGDKDAYIKALQTYANAQSALLHYDGSVVLR